MKYSDNKATKEKITVYMDNIEKNEKMPKPLKEMLLKNLQDLKNKTKN